MKTHIFSINAKLHKPHINAFEEITGMIGYYDPDTLKVGESEGVISFVNAADAKDVTEVRITTVKQAKSVVAALKDQITHGLAGSEGSFRKVRGTFVRLPDSHNEGVITDGKAKVPARMGFEVKQGDLPLRGLCIAMGEMVDGALMVSRMTLAPIGPIPSPNQAIQTPDS